MSTEEQKTEGQATTEETSLLDEILAETKLKPAQEAYEVAQKGVQAFITDLISSGKAEGQRIDKTLVDAMIAEIDQRMSAQLNEILHHKDFQKLESAWRGLKYVIDGVDFRENIKVEMLSVTKDELIADFEDQPELPKSGLYKTVYSAEYGVHGGRPYGLLVGNYSMGPGPQDVELMSNIAAISSMSHAPFISNAGPEFFGAESFEEIPKLKDLKSLFEGPQYAKWNSFRESDDSRYVGLTMPRFMLRLPYGESTVPVKSFNFNEEVTENHDSYLWGHTSNAFAVRVAESFAKFRWAPNIVGPQAGGQVDDLPLHQYEAMGEVQTKIPTEIMLTERREYELSEEGFIGLTYRKGSDNGAFFSANSVQKPKFFGNSEEGKAAETNYRLGTQLPYIFVVTRLAHYIKVLQREQIGTWKERTDLERELNKWISQYVADMENPTPAVRSRRPLKKAQVVVEDVPGQPGWYRSTLKVQPHFKYMGASFELSLVGKLDKS